MWIENTSESDHCSYEATKAVVKKAQEKIFWTHIFVVVVVGPKAFAVPVSSHISHLPSSLPFLFDHNMFVIKVELHALIVYWAIVLLKNLSINAFKMCLL